MSDFEEVLQELYSGAKKNLGEIRRRIDLQRCHFAETVSTGFQDTNSQIILSLTKMQREEE